MDHKGFGMHLDTDRVDWEELAELVEESYRLIAPKRPVARLGTMTDNTEETTIGRVSSAAVREATGRGWEEWLQALDGAGAAAWDHKQIVAYLEHHHPEVASGWWRQSIAVGYEQARGKRVVGQTAGAGFQVGVQRSVAATPADVWEVITSRPDLWLGERAAVAFREGERYAVQPGSSAAPTISGEVRVVKPGESLRMTWQPEGWPAPATLQLTLSQSSPVKTTIRAHLEKLPDADAREAMRERWRQALERIIAATSGAPGRRRGAAP